MNQRALELGLTNTSFAMSRGFRPNIQQEATNYSTALDLAKLCRHALSVPGFGSFVHLSLFGPEGRKPQIELYNLNKLWNARWGKTYGYSGVDGSRPVPPPRRATLLSPPWDNLRLIAVVLGRRVKTSGCRRPPRC